jgi:hypothetical protein
MRIIRCSTPSPWHDTIAGPFTGPSKIQVHADHEGHAIIANLAIENGRYEIDSITITGAGDTPVSRSLLCALILGPIYAAALPYIDIDEEPGSPVDAVRKAVDRLIGRTPDTASEMEDLALAYRWFRIASRTPTESLTKKLGVSRATLHRWTAKAAGRGFLSPPERTR